MHKLTLTASDGEVLTGGIPASWADVPLAAYTNLVAAAQPLPEGLPLHPALAFASEAGRAAVATLLGLPSAEPLVADDQLLRAVFDTSPFLFAGPLPAAGAVEAFTHQGTAYEYYGGLPNATGEQLEALLNFLSAHQGHPLGCGPHLLAILYRPVGQKQTVAQVTAAAQSFATLPMSLAYPALLDFMQRSAPWALATQRYLAVLPAAEQALSALQTAVATALPARSWSMRRWLTRTWIRLVSTQLRTSLLPSTTTATPPTKPRRRAGKGLRLSFRLRFLPR